MRARNDQRRVVGAKAHEHVAAKTVTDEDGIKLSGGHGVDALLDLLAARGRNIVVALGQKLEVDQIGRSRHREIDFTEGDFAGDDFKKHD